MNCKNCKKDKPFDEFFYSSGKNRRPICKTCFNEKRRANYSLNLKEKEQKRLYNLTYRPFKDASDREKISILKSENQTCDVLKIATYLNITPRRVQMLTKRGVIPREGKRGEYNLLPCIHAYISHLKKLLYFFGGSYSARKAGPGMIRPLNDPQSYPLFIPRARRW